VSFWFGAEEAHPHDEVRRVACGGQHTWSRRCLLQWAVVVGWRVEFGSVHWCEQNGRAFREEHLWGVIRIGYLRIRFVEFHGLVVPIASF
jgi:hypothetical protein